MTSLLCLRHAVQIRWAGCTCELAVLGWICLWSLGLHGCVWPLGHRHPGRWENELCLQVQRVGEPENTLKHTQRKNQNIEDLFAVTRGAVSLFSDAGTEHQKLLGAFACWLFCLSLTKLFWNRLSLYPRLIWNSLWNPNWPQTHGNLLAFTSQ